MLSKTWGNPRAPGPAALIPPIKPSRNDIDDAITQALAEELFRGHMTHALFCVT